MARLKTVLVITAVFVIALSGSAVATSDAGSGISAGSALETMQLDWPNGTAVSWTLSYNSLTSLITFAFDNTTLQYTTPLSGIKDVLVRMQPADAGSDILVDNLVLDGASSGSISSLTADGVDILRVSGSALTAGFRLTGQTTLNWTGDRPDQSQLFFRITVEALDVVYVEKRTWGQLKTMFDE